jgi:signal peptidase II
VRSQGLSWRFLLAGSVAAAVVVVDLLTKRWAAATFAGAPKEVLGPLLTFTYTENPGSAFGLISAGGAIFGFAAFIAVGIVIGALLEARPTVEIVGFGMVAGGAVGNLVDRIARGPGLLDGTVIDWIQFPNFPVFNIADSSLTIGVALLLISAWRSR